MKLAFMFILGMLFLTFAASLGFFYTLGFYG